MSTNLGLLASSTGPASSGAPSPVSLNTSFLISTYGFDISLQWRHFPFFNDVPVKDVNDLDSSPDIFKVCL